MKLIKCNVENFGTLSNFSVDFTDGLCVIKEDNGFGKTTVAAFIKAMFYGLPVSKKSDLNENERMKFDPWQGGNFGGSLDFECDKGVYRIERFFGAKAKDDSFKLFNLKTGAQTSDFSENIGVELFGIDAESFERSIFLPQQRLSSEMNASINAKLTGLVENSDDIGNFDTAMAELDKQQKVRGVKGRLDAVNKEIVALERQIADCKVTATGLDVLKAHKNVYRKEQVNLETELETLRKKITVASDMAAVKKDVERRNELLELLEKSKQTVKDINGKYLQIPNAQEVSTAYSLSVQYNQILSGVHMLESDTSDTARLDELENYFKNGVPTASEISACRENLRQFATENAAAEALSGRTQNLPQKQPKKTSQTVVLVLALVLALGGMGLLFVNQAVGIALLTSGVISAGVAGFMVLKNMITILNGTVNSEEIKQNYALHKTNADKHYALSVEFTSKYDGGLPQTVIETVSANFVEYGRLKSACLRKAERLTMEKGKLQSAYLEISKFFIKTIGQMPQNITGCLDGMKDDVKTLKSLSETVFECEEKLKKLPHTEMPEGLDILDREAMLIRENEIGNRLDFLVSEIGTLQGRIDLAERAAEALQEFSSQLDEKNDQKKEFETKLSVVQLTEKFLKDARDSLSARYMTVLKNGFEKYTSEIYGDSVGEFMLDNSLNLNMQRNGASRNRDYFSEGYRDMLDICMRLALCDALYEGEKPMLVLDDPFVNLDDTRVQNALSMLEKLAKNRQIVYLTCHTSRMPE